MTGRVSALYDERVRGGHFERDPEQEGAALRLDALAEALRDYDPSRKTFPLARLFGSKPAPAPRGLYVWGKVGRGKTMLMDLFFEAVETPKKRRAHFHCFMADVHARIHAWRQRKKAGDEKGDDPIAPVAEALAREAWLLCFDEFSVTDIADAMILGRLFQALWAAGTVVVATSNVEPSRLYEGGLNRALFLPFIALIHDRMDVVELNARTDFRLEKLSHEPVYHMPLGPAADAALDRMFEALTGRRKGAPMALDVLGRQLRIPQAVGQAARFDFADLCEAPLGSADYLALAEEFETLFVDGIPAFEPHQRNEAKRFINLIDTLYDQKVKLVASAAASPDDLGRRLEGREAFEFARTSSRLLEMQSSDYLALPHGSHVASGDLGGLIET